MKAINDEFIFRAPPLGELKPQIGKGNSIIVTSVYFGLGN
jgi:hypothetical protein